MELKDLRCFIAVAEAAGFRKGAERLGVETSLVSRRIWRLEEELGLSLFQRHPGGARLTIAGQRFLPAARRLLTQLDHAVVALRSAGKASEGLLRVGITASIASGFLHDLLIEWRSEHSAVRVELIEAIPSDNVRSVTHEELDICFVLGDAWPSGCEVEHIWDDRVFAAVSSETTLHGDGPVGIATFADQTYIVSVGGFGPDVRDFTVKRLYDLGHSPKVLAYDVSREVLLSMVGGGFGATFVSAAETAVAYPGVRFVEIEDELLPFHAVWLAARDNPALRSFLSSARSRARRYSVVGRP